MKIKIIGICFILSVLLNLMLCISITERKPVCGNKHMDNVDRTKDVVPDAKAAREIAGILLGVGKADAKSGQTGNIVYDCRVFFHEPSYEWIVFFYARTPEGEDYMDGGQTVWIRRDYGTVVNYCR